MFSLLDEMECYAVCIVNSSVHLSLIFLAILLSLLMFITYIKAVNPAIRLLSLAGGQISVIAAIATVMHAMNCSKMLSIQIYLAYVTLSTAILLLLPRVYDRILIKRYDAKPVSDIMDWPQEFVKSLGMEALVYYYDSAIPRAFASGRSVFLSIGMIELMEESELKAVLAHEVWHLRHINRTPILRQLSLMSFTGNRFEDELEMLADRFAERVVNKEALDSAKAKIS